MRIAKQYENEMNILKLATPDYYDIKDIQQACFSCWYLLRGL